MREGEREEEGEEEEGRREGEEEKGGELREVETEGWMEQELDQTIAKCLSSPGRVLPLPLVISISVCPFVRLNFHLSMHNISTVDFIATETERGVRQAMQRPRHYT